MPKDKIRWIDIKAIFIIGILYIPAFIYRLFNRDIWLFSERKDEARDNGYWMYKYVKENHKEQKGYYVITKNAEDRKRIEQYGGLINWGSLRHYFIFIATRVRLSAHVDSDTPNFRVTNFMDRHHLLFNKRVFLQHGVTKDKITFGYYNVSRADLLICAGIKEYEFCKNEFGYPEGNVVLTGHARFDNLYNRNWIIGDYILLMPTWRNWLNKCSEDEFKKSDYYKAYAGLLGNKEMLSLLAKNKLSLVFYLHSEMQKYTHLFKNSNVYIIIASQEMYDVQDLLCGAKMLITDQSSVAFDFAYLKKPIVYFQFDYHEYILRQHPKGYFEYEKDGFGPVVSKENYLINYISERVENSFLVEKVYLFRMNNFFKYYDNNNRSRIYEKIKKL